MTDKQGSALVAGQAAAVGNRSHVDDDANEIEALDIQYIRPEAIGEPGARRFRIVVVINGRTIISWMEKEQVRRLGELLLDIMQRLPSTDVHDVEIATAITPDEGTEHQFRAGRMELSYDSDDDRLIVIIHDIESDETAPPSLSFRLSREQAIEFSQEAEILMGAGRPACPMCGRPMGPGPHVCEKQNGHLVHE